jgi:hypothetical protein
MADTLRFHPLLAKDLRDAIRWYDGISGDLGDRFRSGIDTQFDEISRRPRSFRNAFGDVRFARISRFPYLLIFRELGPIVRVLGLFHAASDPAKWRERASES